MTLEMMLSRQLLQRSSFNNTHCIYVFLCLVTLSIFHRLKRDLYEHIFWQLTGVGEVVVRIKPVTSLGHQGWRRFF